MAGSESALL